MSSINPLGDKMNFGRNASGGTNYVSMRDASSILFLVDTPGASSTITFKEALSGTGGSNQVLGSAAATVIPFPGGIYWTNTNGVWTAVPIVAGTNYVLSTGVLTLGAGTPDLAVVWLNQGALSDTFNFISASHSAKAIEYVVSPVDVGRKPVNLKNLYS